MKEKVIKKIEESEVESIKQSVLKNTENLQKLGLLEYRILKAEEEKWQLKEEIANLDKQYSDLLSGLQDKYGKGEINLESGEIILTEENTPELTETPEAV